jgi:rubrerythrin
MDLERAITTAIEFETKVRDSYLKARDKTQDPKGRRVFEVLCSEEQGHIDYLRSRLEEWNKAGKISPAKLETTLPSREQITAGLARLRSSMKTKPSPGSQPELQLLHAALQAEQETAAFYLRMVSELPPEGRTLFARFLEIEQGHVAIVQAEIDAVSGLGFWFDVQEFRLESA